MRQIIVDHARRKDSVNRGGGVEVTDIDGNSDIVGASAEQALDLDAALTELAVRDADLARVVEWHFFAGMTFKERVVPGGKKAVDALERRLLVWRDGFEPSA